MKKHIYLYLLIILVGQAMFSTEHSINNIIDNYIRKSNWQEAKRELLNYIKDNPKDSEGYSLLSVVCNELKQYDEAITNCRRAIINEQSMEKKGELYFNLGTYYYNRGTTNIALTMFEKSIELNNLIANPYYMIGLIYYEKNDLDNCMVYWQKYVDISTESDKRDQVTLVIEQWTRMKTEIIRDLSSDATTDIIIISPAEKSDLTDDTIKEPKDNNKEEEIDVTPKERVIKEDESENQLTLIDKKWEIFYLLLI